MDQQAQLAGGCASPPGDRRSRNRRRDPDWRCPKRASGSLIPINRCLIIVDRLRCVFTNGTFVEPIEVWNAPRELTFGVAEQPRHLDEYGDIQRGQFLL